MATLYKRGRSYYLQWTEGGQQFRRSLGPIDRKAAEAIRAEKEAERAGLIRPRSGYTVGAVIAEYLAWAEHDRPASFRKLKSDLGVFSALENYPAEGIDPRHFHAALVKRGASSATNHKALRILRAAYRRVLPDKPSPAERVPLPKIVLSREPQWFRPHELAALGERDPLWVFMAHTGLRRGEIAKARRSDIHGGMLRVESTAEGRTKSGLWRAVPLSPQALEALASLGADYLTPYHADTLSDRFRADADALGLAGTLHGLRHTFCTYLAQAGVSAHEIKRLAGHSSLSVTERYMHHAPGYGRDAIAKLSTWASTEIAQAQPESPLSP